LGCDELRRGVSRQPLGTPIFGKGYTSYMTVVVSLRDFIDEMQILVGEKGIAHDY
jgi:hypothetical protein